MMSHTRAVTCLLMLVIAPIAARAPSHQQPADDLIRQLRDFPAVLGVVAKSDGSVGPLEISD